MISFFFVVVLITATVDSHSFNPGDIAVSHDVGEEDIEGRTLLARRAEKEKEVVVDEDHPVVDPEPGTPVPFLTHMARTITGLRKSSKNPIAEGFYRAIAVMMKRGELKPTEEPYIPLNPELAPRVISQGMGQASGRFLQPSSGSELDEIKVADGVDDPYGFHAQTYPPTVPTKKSVKGRALSPLQPLNVASTGDLTGGLFGSLPQAANLASGQSSAFNLVPNLNQGIGSIPGAQGLQGVGNVQQVTNLASGLTAPLSNVPGGTIASEVTNQAVQGAQGVGNIAQPSQITGLATGATSILPGVGNLAGRSLSASNPAAAKNSETETSGSLDDIVHEIATPQLTKMNPLPVSAQKITGKSVETDDSDSGSDVDSVTDTDADTETTSEPGLKIV